MGERFDIFAANGTLKFVPTVNPGVSSAKLLLSSFGRSTVSYYLIADSMTESVQLNFGFLKTVHGIFKQIQIVRKSIFFKVIQLKISEYFYSYTDW